MSIDLHIHSNASDGKETVLEILTIAKKKGLSAIALTDHDSVRRVPDLLLAARKLDFEVITGVEISLKDEPERGLEEAHLLAYGFEFSQELMDTLLKLEYAKVDWLKDQVKALESLGTISLAEVLRDHPDRILIRRPHVCQTFCRLNPDVEEGDFFDQTDVGGKCFAKQNFELPLEEAVRIVCEAGGVPVLAHPGEYYNSLGSQETLKRAEKLVRFCADKGVMGLEVYYPYERGKKKLAPDDAQAFRGHFEKLAFELDLIPTGGSDFHGKPGKAELGEGDVPDECLLGLMETILGLRD